MPKHPERFALLLLLSGSLAAQAAEPADVRWGQAYLDTVVAEMLERSGSCQVPASPRFFELSGSDYTLNLGGGSAEIIGRGTWGAGPPIPEGRSWVPYPAESSVCSWYSRITVHHTHSLYFMKFLQYFHQTLDDPYADVAYHFFIDTDGKIYEGRPLGYKGSHTERDNTSNVGIVLNGDFEERAPAPVQLKALRRLLLALRCPCAPLEGIWTHQQRQTLNFPADPEHFTACPGQYLATQVYGLAAELGVGPLTRRLPDQTLPPRP